MRVEFICATCGKQSSRQVSAKRYAERANGKMYCSMACRQTGDMRVCTICGKSFYAHRRTIETRRMPWRCGPCGNAAKKAGEYRTCKTCGKAFYVYPSTLKQPKRSNEYCSNACYNTEARRKSRESVIRTPEWSAHIAAGKKGKPNPKNRKPPVVIKCLNCGVEVTWPGRLTHQAKNIRFCSTNCWYDYIRKFPEEHPSWKGGAYPYCGPNLRHQAKLARERDNHTCQICGLHQFNPRLHVHHIRPRVEFNGDFEAANRLENLMTVCRSCHTTIHNLS